MTEGLLSLKLGRGEREGKQVIIKEETLGKRRSMQSGGWRGGAGGGGSVLSSLLLFPPKWGKMQLLSPLLTKRHLERGADWDFLSTPHKVVQRE